MRQVIDDEFKNSGDGSMQAVRVHFDANYELPLQQHRLIRRAGFVTGPCIWLSADMNLPRPT